MTNPRPDTLNQSTLVESLRANAEDYSGGLQCEAADTIEALCEALEVLLNEAENFSVSGVYFDEDCMGHKGPEMARAALAKAANATP